MKLFFEGAFVPYDVYKNPTEPNGKAFSVGKFGDDSPAYVGMMNTPAAHKLVKLSTSEDDSGAYNWETIHINNINYKDRINEPGDRLAYLLNYPDFIWVPVDKIYRRDLTFVKISSGQDTYHYIGRTKVEANSDPTDADLVKVNVQIDVHGTISYTPSDAAEVLTCKSAYDHNLPPWRRRASCPSHLKGKTFNDPGVCPFERCRAADDVWKVLGIVDSHAGYRCVDY